MREPTTTGILPLSRRGARRAVACLVLVALTLAACAASHRTGTPATAAPQALRAGIAPIFPPLAFDKKGGLAGVEVDFAHKLGPALGTQVAMVETPWEDLIPALREHRIDIIMSGMSITAERQQLVSFAHPYLRVGQMMALRRVDAKRLSTETAIDRSAIRAGFVTGTTGEAYVHAHLKRVHPVGLASVDAAAAALRAQQIDVFVCDAPSIYRITAGGDGRERELVGRYEPLTEEYLAWAVRKEDDALRARLDTVLTQWNSDGTLDTVLGKWIQVRRRPPQGKEPSR